MVILGCIESEVVGVTKNGARYQTIAYEIAKRIVAGKLDEGDKMRGRSMLAGEFEVSSETIRKAMRLLANLGVVQVKQRSGIYVLSRNAAEMYVEQYRSQSEAHKLFSDTLELLEESERIQSVLQRRIKRLLETAKSDVFPFDFFTLRLRDTDKNLGKSLKALKFWGETHGLVLAIEAEGQLYQAPNPNMPLEAGMILYVLGDENVKKKTLSLFKPEED